MEHKFTIQNVNGQLPKLTTLFEAIAQYYGASITVETVTQVVTESDAAANVIAGILGCEVKSSSPVFVIEPVWAGAAEPTPEEPAEASPVVGVEAESKPPAPGRGLVPANVKDRDAVCWNCGQHFIRRRKGQTHCMKPECQKEKKREYMKEYRVKEGEKPGGEK